MSPDEFRIVYEPPGRRGAYRLGQSRGSGLDHEPAGRGENYVTLSLSQLGESLTERREPLDRLAGVDPNHDGFDPPLVLPDIDPVAIVGAPDAQLAAPGDGPRQQPVQRAAPASGRLACPPGVSVARLGGSGHQMQIELPASHVKSSAGTRYTTPVQQACQSPGLFPGVRHQDGAISLDQRNDPKSAPPTALQPPPADRPGARLPGQANPSPPELIEHGIEEARAVALRRLIPQLVVGQEAERREQEAPILGLRHGCGGGREEELPAERRRQIRPEEAHQPGNRNGQQEKLPHPAWAPAADWPASSVTVMGEQHPGKP